MPQVPGRQGYRGADLNELVDNLYVIALETMLRCDQCGNREHNAMQVAKSPRNI